MHAKNMSGPSPSKQYVAFLKKKPPSMTATISNDIMFSLNCLFSINKVRKAYADMFALVIPEQSQPEHGALWLPNQQQFVQYFKIFKPGPA